ncbi:insulin-like growth factor 2 [Petromyzon marinus]|uniref:Insulin-like growth factor 2 n=1 Tax=Petromyzon marinus TaxID=7757 RepID=A0AAJ7TFK2_PETMA|nr:insulin-like growth factor II [Petromyzon marinus]
MEYKGLASCSLCRFTFRTTRTAAVGCTAARPLTLLAPLLLMLLLGAGNSRPVRASETLCGSELVDALQFVCGDRGFYFVRHPSSRSHGRPKKGIVEECCFSKCDLRLLEMYCAKPAKSERDVRPPSFKDLFKKSMTNKYSNHAAWPEKSHEYGKVLPRSLPAPSELRALREAKRNRQLVTTHRPLVPRQARPARAR